MRNLRFLAGIMAAILLMAHMPAMPVTMAEETIAIEKIAIDGLASRSLGIGQSMRLYPIVTPSEVYEDGNLVWKSSNTAIAKVDQNGLVSGVKTGLAVITLTAGDLKATVTVNVTAAKASIADAYLGSLKVNGDSMSGFIPTKLSYAVTLPHNAEIPAVEAVAADASSQVHVSLPEILPGEAAITVVAKDNKTTKTYTISFGLGDGPSDPPVAVDRIKYDFNSDWKFTKDESDTLTAAGAYEVDFDDSAWSSVSTPHTYNDVDTFTEFTPYGMMGGVSHYTGKSWYRKYFQVDEDYKDKKVFIEFEAARQAADVYINGIKLSGRSENGFIAFGYDLTDYLHYDGTDNILAVMVDNTADLKIEGTDSYIPWNNSHWHPNHGGLYRNVYLHMTDKLHITLPLYSFLKTQGTYVYAGDISNSSARITANAEVFNEYDEDKAVSYLVKIQDEDGNTVLTMEDTRTLAAGEVYNFSKTGTISQPKLWSTDYPYLYTAVSSVSVSGEGIIDTSETSLGIRHFEFTNSEGFYLNGNQVKLTGWGQKPTNEWAGLGAAYPDWMQDYVYQLMHSAGGNFVRFGHSAGGAAAIKSADKYGLVVLQPGVDGEGPSNASSTGYEQFSDKPYTKESIELRISAMQDMVIYFRNNPSIALWESSNKVLTDSSLDQYELDKRLLGMVEKWDPNGGRYVAARRPGTKNQNYIDVTVTTEGDWELRSIGKPGVEGEYNREEAARRVWDRYTEGYENYTTAANSSYNLTTEDFAKNQAAQFSKINYSQHSGGGNWIFSDSTSHGRVMSEVSRVSGEVDAVMLPKEAYWAIQVIYSEEPGMYLIGHWNYPSDTVKPIYVMAKGAARVDLYVNDELIGSNTSPTYQYLYTFDDVAYQAGKIEAIAYDENGIQILESSKETHGEPARVKLTPIVGPDGLLATGSDILLVDAEVLDATGNRCLTYEGRIDFTYDGPAIWRGGYNSGKEYSTNNTYLDIEAGINRVALRTTLEPGTIRVSGSLANEGITSNTVNVASHDIDLANGLSLQLPQTYAFTKTMSQVPYGPGPTGSTSEYQDNVLFQDFAYSGPGDAYVKNNTNIGQYAFSDEGLTFKNLPSDLLGGEYIQLPNQDKNYGGTTDFVNFKAGEHMTVYVAFSDLNTKPTWLDERFTILEDKVTLSNEETFTLYAMELSKDDNMYFSDNIFGVDTRANGSIYMVFGVSSLSSEVDALSMTIDGVALDGFNKDIMAYDYFVSRSVSAIPVVESTAVSENATVAVTHAEAVPGMTTVTITAENGRDSKTYYIRFVQGDALVVDRFDEQAVATSNSAAPPTGWSRINSATAGSSALARVEAAPLIGLPNKVLRIYDNSTGASSQVVVSKNLGSLENRKLTASFNLYWAQVNNPLNIMRFILSGENNTTNRNAVAVELYIKGGEIHYRNASDVEIPTGKSLAIQTWNTVRVDANQTVGTYDIYLNEEKIASNLPLRSDNISYVQVGSVYAYRTNAYFDNIQIYDVSDASVSDEAALSGISIGKMALPGFEPDDTEYEFVLPATMSFSDFAVTAAPSYALANVEITQPTPEEPTAVITVTSGATTNTYTIAFYFAHKAAVLYENDFEGDTPGQLPSEWAYETHADNTEMAVSPLDFMNGADVTSGQALHITDNNSGSAPNQAVAGVTFNPEYTELTLEFRSYDNRAADSSSQNHDFRRIIVQDGAPKNVSNDKTDWCLEMYLMNISGNANQFQVQVRDGTNHTIAQAQNGIHSSREWHDFKIVLNRITGTYTVYVDGAQAGAAYNITGTNTKMDCILFGSGGTALADWYIDDIKVTAPTVAE